MVEEAKTAEAVVQTGKRLLIVAEDIERRRHRSGRGCGLVGCPGRGRQARGRVCRGPGPVSTLRSARLRRRAARSPKTGSRRPGRGRQDPREQTSGPTPSMPRLSSMSTSEPPASSTRRRPHGSRSRTPRRSPASYTRPGHGRGGSEEEGGSGSAGRRYGRHGQLIG